ncbi:unnamed protein product [Candidula unifasciata]|uniref:G-protein coupled receptors family 1 profile domain-containing protein n=1 Tax=Candidula unifasciata TaxID=100452 RepID=A0A8S3ZCT1_9EUPU|nr:unnamed protein product [Candidula unifasciata]
MSSEDTTSNVSLTPTTAISDSFMNNERFHQTGGLLYDFYQMAAVDWDEIHDREKLTSWAYTTWNALNIVRLTLAIWILASHIALIVFVLAKKALRQQPKNLLIINVALVNVLMGMFVVPVKLHFILNPKGPQCNLAVGWTFVAEYYQPSACLFAVLSLVLERFIYVYTEKTQKNIKPWAAKIGTTILMFLPWILSCLILLPIFYAGLLAKFTDPNQCLFKVNEGYFVASQLMSFILPSLGVFILAPFTGLLDCLRPKRCFYKPLTPRGESMAITATVSLVSIFCEAPYCVVRVLMMTVECNNSYCSRFSEALTLAMWIRVCKAGVFPFIWLAYTDIRDALLHLNNAQQKDKETDYDNDDDDEDGGQKFPLTKSSSKAV